MKKVLFCFIIVMCPLYCFGEGYQVNLQSQRQIGMGHTGTGQQLGATSMHFNPGALGFLESRFEFSAGVSGVFSNNSFQKEAPSLYEHESDNPPGTPFFFYGAGKLSEKMVVGFSVTTPYGNSLDWGKEWDGRFLIQDIDLKSIFMQPTISYQLTDRLSIGAGVVVAYGFVDLNKALPLQSSDLEGSVRLKGETWAMGYHAGVFFQTTDKLSMGLDYRSKILMKIRGSDAEFTVPNSLVGEQLFPENNKFDTELPMPANITFGLGYALTKKWLLAADFQFVEWTAYEELVFDFEKNTSVLSDSENLRGYENTVIVRLGTEYKLSSRWQLRVGGYYDPTPIPEGLLTSETPGANKLGVSCGFSWGIVQGMSLDGSLLYIQAEKRKDGYEPLNFYGTYYSNGFLPGLGITYMF